MSHHINKLHTKTLNVSSDATVLGNIVVNGTVDARDIAADGGYLDTLYTTIGLSALTSGEVDQLENIGSTTISGTQWGYLGALDQELVTTSSVSFAQVTVDEVKLNDGVITYSGTTGNNKVVIPDNLASSYLITDGTQNYIEIVSSTGSDQVKVLQDLDITGDLTISGTVDGRDIDADGTKLDSLYTTIGLSALTSGEVDQLENIGSTTISGTQWGYLGALDQGLVTSSTVAFAQVTVDNIVVNGDSITNTVSGNDLTLATTGAGRVLVSANPTVDLGVATKQYVDGLVQGISAHEACRVKTIAALPTYTQAGAGVGATLTANAVGVLTIDGVAVALNDRVLVDTSGAAAGSDVGIYYMSTEGTAGVAWVLTRALDADESDELKPNSYCFVSEGTSSADTGWLVSTDGTITIDTTTVTWVQFSQAGTINAVNYGTDGGVGIFKEKSGTDLRFYNLDSGSSKISVTLDAGNNEIDIDLVQTNITATGILDGGSITSGFGSINIGTSAITAGSLSVDELTLDSGVITYSGTTGNNKVVVPDNLASAFLLTDGTQNYLQVVSTTGSDQVKILQNLDVTGDLTISGTVDGRDIDADGTKLDSLYTTIGLSALTSGEVDQLENIGSTTISGTQWGYLGALDQGLVTTSTVAFAQVTVDEVKLNDGVITYSGVTGNNKIVIPDNLASAFLLTDGTQNYLQVVSTTGGDQINLLQNTELTGNFGTTGYIQFDDMSAPSNPSDGEGRLYKKTSDPGLYWRPDSSGTEINVAGSVMTVTTYSTASVSPTQNDGVVKCTYNTGAITVNLPAVAASAGKHYHVINNSTAPQTLTVKPQTGEKLNSVVNDTVEMDTEGDNSSYFCDGVSWYMH